MSTSAPAKLPRKKRSILWWLLALILLLLGLFFFQLFGPNPSIQVSRETTYVTEPIDDDGLPDYERYILNEQRQGVLPENNAAVLLAKALGPGDLKPAEFAAVAAEIGLSPLPTQDEILVSPYREVITAQINDWQKTQPVIAANGSMTSDPADDVLERAAAHPWTSDEIPPLAKWVADNQAPIDLLVEASKRPQYYWPSPSLLNKQSEMLIALNFFSIQSVRNAARALTVHAMWNLGEGRPMDAWQDILAIHRIARFCGQGNTLIELLVAIAIDGIACEATQTIVAEGRLSSEQCRQILNEFSELPRFNGMSRALDRGERLMAVDIVTQFAARGDSEFYDMGDMNELAIGGNVLRTVSVDWNLVLRDTNRCFDRLVEAASRPDRPSRESAVDDFQLEINQSYAGFVGARSPVQLLAAVVSRRQRSELVAATMFGLFLPAIEPALNAQDRANTTLNLTRVAIALAAYRAEHGGFPAKLDDLAPGILDTLPLDIYNAQPFRYSRDGQGYLLYSVGENGVDDSGKDESDDYRSASRARPQSGQRTPRPRNPRFQNAGGSANLRTLQPKLLH